MGVHGPAPKPTELKLLAGNPSEHKLNENEPKPPIDLYPIAPDWLSDEARVHWERGAKLLTPLRLLTRADYTAFGRYCELMTEWLKAKHFIQEHGSTYPLYEYVPEVGADGHIIIEADGRERLVRRLKYLGQVPQVAIFRNLAIEMRQLEQEFGLTPASRTRISVEDAKGEKLGNNIWDKFKQRRPEKTSS